MTLTPDDIQALQRIADSLERAARELRRIAGDPVSRNKRKSASLPENFLDVIRSAGRDAAVQQLATLSQSQLGELFVQLGGSGSDKKRNKEWLTDRILWRLFDFQSGHEIIRGQS